MRLAWFTPWSEQPSGVAGRSVELVSALTARGHAIDVCVDAHAVRVPGAASPDAPRAGEYRTQSAHDFIWRAARGQYDLCVYQIGNSHLHDFIWPYALRYPGLTLLHDARLHHARARALLSQGRLQAYREEFAWAHPDVTPDAAELAIAGFDGAYYFQWPMVRAIVEASRLVAVHTRGGATDIQDAWPRRHVDYIPLGEGSHTMLGDDARRQMRERLGVGGAAVVFGVFGALTAEKRVPQILRAFARTLSEEPDARLVLAGTADPKIDIPALAQAAGVGHALALPTRLDDDAFDRALAAVDVSLNLRWPTAVETSGPWIRALAAGRATVVTDLAHQAHVPALDARTWQPKAHRAGQPVTIAPVTIAIDVLDEDHSLTIAMRRLAADPVLRASLGQSARRYWETMHTPEIMMAACDRALHRACTLPVPVATMPPAVMTDPVEHARDLLRALDLPTCKLF